MYSKNISFNSIQNNFVLEKSNLVKYYKISTNNIYEIIQGRLFFIEIGESLNLNFIDGQHGFVLVIHFLNSLFEKKKKKLHAR